MNESPDPIRDLMRAIRAEGKPPLEWAIRWSEGGREPVAAAWRECCDPRAMLDLLDCAKLPSKMREEVLAAVLCARDKIAVWADVHSDFSWDGTLGPTFLLQLRTGARPDQSYQNAVTISRRELDNSHLITLANYVIDEEDKLYHWARECTRACAIRQAVPIPPTLQQLLVDLERGDG